MISLLSGVVRDIHADHLVLEVAGVGYQLHCHGRTLAGLPAPGAAVRMHTELQLRSDSLRLYGFQEARERDWFRLLCGVHHVGARGALSILGVLAPAELAEAVAVGDVAAVQRAPGIGRRIAERVVLELKGKAPAAGMAPPASPRSRLQTDAVLALTGLGFAADVALAAVRATVAAAPEAPLEAVIHAALRQLGQADG